MRKKLDTRFPAARIKKIMQADEDVGKIALAVPVLVSKALELFLQDLCDRTYNVTVQRGMKTMSSLHLKQCVHGFNHYDFLRDIVSKVPDMGTNDGVPAGEDNKPTRRRKATEDEESEEDTKRVKTESAFRHPTITNTTNTNTTTGTGTSNGTGRGRGRPRGSGKGRRSITRGTEDDPVPLRNFDLNLDVSENMPPPSPLPSSPAHSPVPAPGPPAHYPTPAPGPPAQLDVATQLATQDQFDVATQMAAQDQRDGATQMAGQHEELKEEYGGWSMEEMKKMAMGPVQFVLAHGKVEEEEENYDEEEG